MNRRDLLGFASAGVALAVLRPPAAAALSGWWPRTVIYDERYGDARAFADYFRAHGVASLPTRGDGTALWYGGSGQMGGAVAGLTAYSDLVIARSCGRERGLRLVFEGRHAGGIDAIGYPDRVGHLARGPAGLVTDTPSRISTGGREGIEATDRPSCLVAWLLMPRTIRAMAGRALAG